MINDVTAKKTCVIEKDYEMQLSLSIWVFHIFVIKGSPIILPFSYIHVLGFTGIN